MNTNNNYVNIQARRRLMMNLSNDAEKKETHIEKKSDSSLVLTTFIKYAAYLIMFFGVMYFIVSYILPKF